MYKIILLFAALLLSANTIVFADQSEQVITLKDGSQIKGQLAGINNGVYTVVTPIIGNVQVSANDVVSITNANGGATAPVAVLPTTIPVSTGPTPVAAPSMNQQIIASQQQLMSNPQSMAVIQQMMQDPEIMQALQDPALVQAVTNHDYQAVQSNPKIQEMMSNPKMQALLQQLAAQQPQQQQQQQQNTSSQ